MPQIEDNETIAAKETAGMALKQLREVEKEHDELLREVRSLHARIAVMGGGPCVCKWCERA